nr:hypothetical protein [Tanacetum cinerariifolium]
DLTTRYLAQFFPPGRTAKLHKDILMFQQHKAARRTIDQSTGGKLHDRNAEESWALLEDLALYDIESWNDPMDFAKLVKAISLPQDVLSTFDRRLIKLENQYCMKNPEQAFVDYASLRTDEVEGKEVTFKTPFKDSERSKLTSDGHDLVSSRIILSEDDYDRGCERPSDLESGFYKNVDKLGLEYQTEPKESNSISEVNNKGEVMIILSEDDYDRGCERPSDLESGFYKNVDKLGLEYQTEPKESNSIKVIRDLVRVDQDRIVKKVPTSFHRVLLLQSWAMKLSKLFQLAFDVHKCRMIPQLVIILEGEMCTSEVIRDLVRVDQDRIVKKVPTSFHRVLLLQSWAMKLSKLFQLAFDVHKCRMIPQLVIILEGEMCTSGNIVTNSRVTPSWREIVSLTFSEAGVLHVNWISFGHCMFLALGWHLEEIHMTWDHLEKKQTRLRLYTKYLEEPRIQSVETASPV